MKIQIGYELIYNFRQATPMLLMVNVHYSRASDIVIPDHLTTEPSVPITAYRDGFGNWCSRIQFQKMASRFSFKWHLPDLMDY